MCDLSPLLSLQPPINQIHHSNHPGGIERHLARRPSDPGLSCPFNPRFKSMCCFSSHSTVPYEARLPGSLLGPFLIWSAPRHNLGPPGRVDNHSGIPCASRSFGDSEHLISIFFLDQRRRPSRLWDANGLKQCPTARLRGAASDLELCSLSGYQLERAIRSADKACMRVRI